jgi:D-ribose pyranose/furanose isomerase RbsD
MIEMTAIPPISLQNYRIAAIIPCHNEELTIAESGLPIPNFFARSGNLCL